MGRILPHHRLAPLPPLWRRAGITPVLRSLHAHDRARHRPLPPRRSTFLRLSTATEPTCQHAGRQRLACAAEGAGGAPQPPLAPARSLEEKAGARRRPSSAATQQQPAVSRAAQRASVRRTRHAPVPSPAGSRPHSWCRRRSSCGGGCQCDRRYPLACLRRPSPHSRVSLALPLLTRHGRPCELLDALVRVCAEAKPLPVAALAAVQEDRLRIHTFV
jgi:hypothetical protein